ncbi:GPI-anchored cell wall organization protein Ecm33 [Apiospora marii]|uniref:GPI-anchored cell wall organization protein Ecm33 n=1 Tax=Apiospora marii TaxID=335849 RepID=A0ABR1QZV5_9PEZI
MMRPSPRRPGLLACFSLLLSAATTSAYNPVHCDSITVHSQADVDAAVIGKGCQVIDDEVVLASDATGDIDLSGIDSIDGSLRSEKGSQVTTLHHKGIWYIQGDLLLQDMPKLQNVSFKHLLEVGQHVYGSGGRVVLDNLPAATGIDLYSLAAYSEFRAVDLPRLDEFWQRKTPQYDTGTVEIRNVGLASLAALTLLDTGDEIQTSRHNIDHLRISGSYRGRPQNPRNVPGVLIQSNYTARLDLDLDGDSAVWLRAVRVGRARVSGVRELRRAGGGAIDELVVTNSSNLVDLRLASIASLDIQDLPRFEGFRGVASSWFDWTAPTSRASEEEVPTRRLVMRGLPSMHFHPATTHVQNASDVDGLGHAAWVNGYCRGTKDKPAGHYPVTPDSRCMGNLTHVELAGNISNDFFEDFLFAFCNRDDRIDIRNHGRVTELFSLESTDPAFNCTALDELRGVGLFAGEYSCNGRTAPVTRDAWAEAEERASSGGGGGW